MTATTTTAHITARTIDTIEINMTIDTIIVRRPETNMLHLEIHIVILMRARIPIHDQTHLGLVTRTWEVDVCLAELQEQSLADLVQVLIQLHTRNKINFLSIATQTT